MKLKYLEDKFVDILYPILKVAVPIVSNMIDFIAKIYLKMKKIWNILIEL